MKLHKVIKWVGWTVVIVLSAYVLLRYLIFPLSLSVIFSSYPTSQSEKSPEEVFTSRVLDGQSIPSDVSEIKAKEGPMEWGASNREAFIRFEATELFITELIKTDQGFYGLYVQIPCEKGPIKDDLVKSAWWKPSELDNPICYSASTCILYDHKYLMIDSSKDVGYFYRTAVCGLCPSGKAGQELRESSRCKNSSSSTNGE